MVATKCGRGGATWHAACGLLKPSCLKAALAASRQTSARSQRSALLATLGTVYDCNGPCLFTDLMESLLWTTMLRKLFSKPAGACMGFVWLCHDSLYNALPP